MPDTSTLGLFLIASLAILVVPGPAVLYIVARGIHQGRSAALVSTLGVEVGTLIQLLAATLGLSVLVTSSDVGFSILKYSGAVVLVLLAFRTLSVRSIFSSHGRIEHPDSLWRMFFQGVVVEVLNPKTAIFLLAFLPQFADPDRGSAGWQMLTLGLIFILLAMFNDSLFALMSGALGGWLGRKPGFLTCQKYVSSSVYLGLALMTVISSHGP